MPREIVCLWTNAEAQMLYDNCEKLLDEMMGWYAKYDLTPDNRQATDAMVARTQKQMAELVSKFTVPAVIMEKMPPPP